LTANEGYGDTATGCGEGQQIPYVPDMYDKLNVSQKLLLVL